jgi:glycosyltransferase involved in cell wall biosynthesis
MPREIVVNGRFLSRRITGVERYAREIMKRFPAGGFRLEQTEMNGARGHAWEQFILPGRLSRESVLWSPANTGPLLVRNQVLTIQDLSTLEHPEWFRASFAAWYRVMLPLLARRARTIVAPSDYVKRKITERFRGVKAIAIPSGVDVELFHPGARRSRPDLPQRYILFVGSLEPRKNLPALIRAWKQVQGRIPELSLVIVGASGNVFRPVNLPQGLPNLHFIGHAGWTLPSIYANAELFVLPSLDEGFGLPVLEAMACGTPVLVSNGGALPEAAGDAGLIFDLAQPDSLASLMEQCVTDSTLRARLIEKGLARAREFSWQKTADEIWKTLNE